MKCPLFCILFILVTLPSLWGQVMDVERNGQGHIVSSSHGVVDANDHLAVVITYGYDSVGVVETRTLQSYDNQGRPIRKEVYTADEYLLYTEDNKYDCRGNRTRCIQTTYDEEGRSFRNDYRYRYSRLADGSWQLMRIRLNGEDIYREE